MPLKSAVLVLIDRYHHANTKTRKSIQQEHDFIYSEQAVHISLRHPSSSVLYCTCMYFTYPTCIFSARSSQLSVLYTSSRICASSCRRECHFLAQLTLSPTTTIIFIRSRHVPCRGLDLLQFLRTFTVFLFDCLHLLFLCLLNRLFLQLRALFQQL